MYGWLILAVSFAVILIGAGTRSAPGALPARDRGGHRLVEGPDLAGQRGGAAPLYAIAYIAAGWMAIGAGVVALALRRVPASATPVPAAAG
jgi:hypothetical protein